MPQCGPLRRSTGRTFLPSSPLGCSGEPDTQILVDAFIRKRFRKIAAATLKFGFFLLLARHEKWSSMTWCQSPPPGPSLSCGWPRSWGPHRYRLAKYPALGMETGTSPDPPSQINVTKGFVHGKNSWGWKRFPGLDMFYDFTIKTPIPTSWAPTSYKWS